MNFKLLQHLHLTFAILYIVTYSIKVLLYLTKNNSFASYRKKTLIPENILACLFLITGILLVVKINAFATLGGWFHAKLTMVILSIPIGIVGFKKENKILVLASLLLLLGVLGLALAHYH